MASRVAGPELTVTVVVAVRPEDRRGHGGGPAPDRGDDTGGAHGRHGCRAGGEGDAAGERCPRSVAVGPRDRQLARPAHGHPDRAGREEDGGERGVGRARSRRAGVRGRGPGPPAGTAFGTSFLASGCRARCCRRGDFRTDRRASVASGAQGFVR